MDKDFVTAEETYFLERWPGVRRVIREAIVDADREGRGGTKVFIRCSEKRDCRFVDFIIKKLEEAGYDAHKVNHGYYVAIYIGWRAVMEWSDFY